MEAGADRDCDRQLLAGKSSVLFEQSGRPERELSGQFVLVIFRRKHPHRIKILDVRARSLSLDPGRSSGLSIKPCLQPVLRRQCWLFARLR